MLIPLILVATSRDDVNAPNILKNANIHIVTRYNTKKLIKNCPGVLARFVKK